MKHEIHFFLLLFLSSTALFSTYAEERTIDVNGTLREYIIEVPSGYDGTVPYDLIIVYHGMTGTALQTAYTGFHLFGETYNFITIYPQGLDDIENVFNPGTTTTGWRFELANNRDVTFTETLLDSIEAEYNIDPSGIFITGISNGGYFSDILACNIGDRLAAIAPVIGGFPLSVVSQCSVAKKLPVLHLGSEYDGVVDIEHLRSATEYWVEHNECEAAPVSSGICDVYSGTEAGAIVQHCEFVCIVGGQEVTSKNAGCHTWPTSFTGYDFDATELILDFFLDNGLGQTSISDHFHKSKNRFNGRICSNISYNIDNSAISFRLLSAGTVYLNLYSLNGSLIAQPLPGRYLSRGIHKVPVKISAPAGGIYLIKFTFNGDIVADKIVIIDR